MIVLTNLEDAMPVTSSSFYDSLDFAVSAWTADVDGKSVVLKDNPANVSLTRGTMLNVSGTSTYYWTTFSLYDNGVLLGTVTTGNHSLEKFTLATPHLADGFHKLTLRAFSLEDYSREEVSRFVIVDTQVSIAEINSTLQVSSGKEQVTLKGTIYSTDNTPTLSGSAELGSRIDFFDRANGQDTALGSIGSAGGLWTFTPTLGKGEHYIVAVVTDTAGNVATSNMLSVTVVPELYSNQAYPARDFMVSAWTADIDGKSVVLKDNPAGVNLTRGAMLHVSGAVHTPTTFNLYDNGELLSSVTAGNYSLEDFTLATPHLADGLHKLTLRTSSEAGNSHDELIRFVIVDSQVSIAEINSTLIVSSGKEQVTFNGTIYSTDNSPTLSGSAELGSRIDFFDRANGKDTALASIASSEGLWTFTPTLGKGEHDIVAVVTDTAGNVATSNMLSVTVAPQFYTGQADPTHDSIRKLTDGNDYMFLDGARGVNGGRGNDKFYLTQTPAGMIDGGTGEDAIKAVGSGIVLEEGKNVRNFDYIDLTGAGGNTYVIDQVIPSSYVIKIDGDGDDHVYLKSNEYADVGDGWETGYHDWVLTHWPYFHVRVANDVRVGVDNLYIQHA